MNSSNENHPGINFADTPEFLFDPNLKLGSNPDITGKLTGDEKSVLFRAAVTRHYKKNDILWRQGSKHKGIHLIKSGRIRSYYQAPNGKEFTLAFWTQDHFVGAPQMLGGGENMWTSVANQNSTTLWITSEKLVELIQTIPNLALGVIDGLSYKAALYAKIAQVVCTTPIASRLALLLVNLSNYQETDGGQPVILSKSYSQENLAAMIGSTRQAVAQILTQFEDSGIISRDSSIITINNIEELEQISH